MPTVREMVRQMQTEIRDTPDLQPDRACELLNRLTSLIGNCNEEIREADALYAGVLLQFLDSEARANRAKIRAETSQEYQRKREARDAKELCIELCRSMKYYIRSKQEEYVASKNM